MKWVEFDVAVDSPGGALIQAARKRAVVTQSELARRMGITQQAVSRWERGLAEPSFDSVLTAIGACGWDFVTSLAPRSEGRVLPKNVPTTKPATLVLTPQDAADPTDQRTSRLRILKDSQRAWRRERQGRPAN